MKMLDECLQKPKGGDAMRGIMQKRVKEERTFVYDVC
jgi:hypothetical protein